MDKTKAFIITSKKSYDYIHKNWAKINTFLSQIINSNQYMILNPYQIEHHPFLDNLLYDKADVFLPKSDAYINKAISKLPIEQQQNITQDEIKLYVARKQYEFAVEDWLKEKLEYSKEKINEADFCIFIHDYKETDNRHLKELKTELKIAQGKNKRIIKFEIPSLNQEKIHLKNKRHVA